MESLQSKTEHMSLCHFLAGLVSVQPTLVFAAG